MTTEQPYEGDVQISLDPMLVYNSIVATRPGGTTVNSSDPGSMLAYFPRAWPNTPLTLEVADDVTLTYATQFLLGRYSQPQPRIQTVSFRPTANPALWPFCLSVAIGQRVGLIRRPPAAPQITLDLFVESVAHSYDASTGEWVTTLECSPAFWENYQILTAARGTLAASSAVGATTLTLTVPIDAGHNTPDRQGWTPTAITSVQIVDGSNTETLTVSNVVVAFSPSTQVTLTCAATQFAHASGVVVAENPGSGQTYSEYDPAAQVDGNHQVGY